MLSQPGGSFARVRHFRNSVAPGVVLVGKGKGGQALGLCKNILNQLFPNGVSTVPDVTLFEAGLRGLEGPAPGKGPFRWSAVFQKQCSSTNRVNGPREGSPGSGP